MARIPEEFPCRILQRHQPIFHGYTFAARIARSTSAWVILEVRGISLHPLAF